MQIEAVEAAKEEMVESDEWQTPRPVGWTAPGYQSDAVEKIIQVHIPSLPSLADSTLAA